jgi:hypothetical protein
MKIIGPILILAATCVLIFLGLTQPANAGKTVGVTSGATSILKTASSTPELAISNLLTELQHRDWNAGSMQLADTSAVDPAQLARAVAGGDGSLRSLSSLESWEMAPLHETATDAKIRTTIHWSTPVGSIDETRDLQVTKSGDTWKVEWPPTQFTSTPAQVIPVNYLRWDLVTPTGAKDDWGGQNIDAPRVRILSMNAVDYQGRTVVLGEVVNEDTIPAFVNVNATLLGQDGRNLDEESSFDKIAHVLLPKQVSPYRIDFPSVALQKIKDVHMDVQVSLVPASADPIIGVMDEKQTTEGQRASLHGTLLNESGRVVNVPHVIASFYDNNGKVIWVSDGYVQRALQPQTPEPFAVDIPLEVAARVKNYHVVVNQYSIGRD